MLTTEENELLCRVEGDAAMGRMMRRYWLPACMSEEVAERDGAPVRVRVLGEDLVAFRDTQGRLGVVGEHCPHRRASLALGRNEECGLRCLYHGWKVDVDGNVLDMPSEHAGARFAAHVKHIAYPVREAGGFAWIYMGPRDTMPPFEPPAFAPTPGARVSIVKVQVDCNWAQILEGAIDSAHSSTLHSTDMPAADVDRAMAAGGVWPRPSTDKAPRLQVQRTRYGFRYAAIRRPIKDADTHDYVRITTFVAPLTVLIPPNNVYGLANINVPMDDTHTMFYFIAWSDWGPGIEADAWRAFCHARVGVDLDASYRRTRTLANNFGQDRERMKRGDHTGIDGIPNQDMAMWETMGPIADRTRERPGASDVAIVQFRRIMIDAVRRFENGEPPLGTAAPRIPLAKLRSFEGIVPRTTNWRTLGVSDEELGAVETAPGD
ncbi:MAG TPA: Rieske 2Fe-2S domain-containing protein [Casimicrobiaceae bacterium]|jgi:phthalate 4,5-dioxygenase|nr:Rieske 2Fe-2S domain-containing protein [Casimicrobiaceae bacterium]